MGGRSKLDRKQEAVIAALLTEPTHAAAAERTWVGAATLHRWLRRPAFRAAYHAARRSVLKAALARLQQSAGKAVEALERNLVCGNPAHEVRAALGILDQAVKAQELLDLAERLEELERQVAAQTEGPRHEP